MKEQRSMNRTGVGLLRRLIREAILVEDVGGLTLKDVKLLRRLNAGGATDEPSKFDLAGFSGEEGALAGLAEKLEALDVTTDPRFMAAVGVTQDLGGEAAAYQAEEYRKNILTAIAGKRV